MAQINSFIEQAWRHLRADRPKQAMDCAKKAHAISPNSPDVAHLLGLLASRDGKPEIALPLLQKAIDTGGKTPQRLRHIAEALLDAGYPQQALIPLQDALNEFGESTDVYGLKSAIEIALEQWDAATQSSQKAIALNPNLMAWELNLSFAQMMQGHVEAGFKNATARPKNLTAGSLCPALHFSKPCAVWLKSEQGLGDTLFYLRYVAPLVEQGWQFHLEADRKLIPILQNTQLFLSVKEKNNCPNNELSINLGDLPLVAYQTGIKEIPPPLTLAPDAKLVEKYQLELANIGPAPYIAITWRGGPKGQKQRAGIGVLEKVIDPTLLGQALSNTQATIISLQRLPDLKEAQSFNQALGRKPADYSALNNNLAGMLALLSIVDEYITVSNTNLHLREGLAKPSKVFVNRPFQDWRWQAEGQQSIWYPNCHVYRQEKDKTWHPALKQLSQALTNSKLVNTSKKTSSSLVLGSETKLDDMDTLQKHTQLINEGWAVVAHNIPQAIAKASEVLSQVPQNARALHLLGWAAVQDLKFDLGLSVLAQAVQLEPNNGNIWRDYIRAHVLVDKCEDAIRIAQQCLNNRELWARGVVFYALGVAYLQIDDDLEALEAFENCSALIPEHLDAPAYAGLLRMRMGDGYARVGFKLNSARSDVRHVNYFSYWVCPVLKGNITGLNVLIIRSMGFGDELSFLRYLPYLIQAGAKVTYWCGFKLVPLLARLPYKLTLIPDTEPMPDPANYDLAFIKNELPVAVEHLGAPEIADSLPLTVDADKLEKWREWLRQQGDGPYIGISWSAGVSGNIKDGFGYTRLSKKVEPADLATTLTGINATWLSLTRNITKNEINAFEQVLGSPVIDVAGITDDLDDLLCIQALLDENIGVSNTNMHLRACLGLGSRVLVSLASRDWRWGVEGDRSTWFKDCIVYRESKTDGWQTTLTTLRHDLVEQYGLAKKRTRLLTSQQDTAPVQGKKIVWVTAGEIKKGENGYFSPLASAQERVVNVAKLLEAKGWPSVYLLESNSELMGGWHDKLPVKGDVVVFSKVVTEHSINMMHDARARGAIVIVDIFNDFANQSARALHQQKMMQAADIVVSTPELKAKWQNAQHNIAMYFENVNDGLPESKQAEITDKWLNLLVSASNVLKQNTIAEGADLSSQDPSFITNPASAVHKLQHDATQKRVLVGMLYCGENEFDQAKHMLSMQSHRFVECFEICNQPNKQAHDQLYETFMSKANDFDYFLKLDADMVLAHENVITEMLETMVADELAHLFAYVKDCPSGLMIPGVQMFRSDTRWLGSEELLNVDYAPKIYGQSKQFFDKQWIRHMPAPDDYQLFRYGVHKALKSLQPDRANKDLKKGILHLSILNGIARHYTDQPQMIWALMGALLVYQKAFDSIEYNSDQTRRYFEILKNKPHKLEPIKKQAEEFWSTEVQVNYWWLDHFATFGFAQNG